MSMSDRSRDDLTLLRKDCKLISTLSPYERKWMRQYGCRRRVSVTQRFSAIRTELDQRQEEALHRQEQSEGRFSKVEGEMITGF